ncbi:MAG: deoxyribodipyrimidine photo-lyase [Bacteroidetes bacterium]|nr:deoxyribodipyrimidine photo-lyase [Bacteroidota bacterium]
MIDQERIYRYNSIPQGNGPVICWMQRDQRVRDNRALVYAQEKALEIKQPLVVVFCLLPGFPDAAALQFQFMMKGLNEAALSLKEKNISLLILKGDPSMVIPELVRNIDCGLLVSDFNPLRMIQGCKDSVLKKITIPFHEVDAHNVIPARFISQKAEFSAFTLRRKIEKALDDFLKNEIPQITRHPFEQAKVWLHDESIRHKLYSPEKEWPVTGSAQDISWIKPGERSALEALQRFLVQGLDLYYILRNDPNAKGQSELSPYLHFGQLSAERIALEIRKSQARPESRKAFLEELIVRSELADNFCLYNPSYDSFEGFPAWAKTTLNIHRGDPRTYKYDMPAFEEGKTHDPLWNAAQREMLARGKMHGFMRMYWAKKILEWTGSPEEAMAVAVHLNDTGELDGWDPNGYAGIAWSIGGVHDRPWGERPVFGKIRFMNFQGCKRKFDTGKYIKAWS